MNDEDGTDFRLKIDDKWLVITKDFQRRHPGGSVITHYRDADATQVFHAFHEGSKNAYKQLELLKKRNCIDMIDRLKTNKDDGCSDEINISSYNLPETKEKQIVESFVALRKELISEGLFEVDQTYYIYKSAEAFGLLLFAFILQYFTWYLTSAIVLALCWQQFGWLTHDFCHQQPSKNRQNNDVLSLIFGNVMQGFSRDWWKEKHNTHHAATNIVGQDGDIDLAPLLAFVPDDLKKYKTLFDQFISKVIPYQHFYFTFMLPFLRFSWTIQSILFVTGAPYNQYRQHVINAPAEQVCILLHWLWVIFQLWLLPTGSIRILYFAISQLGAGFLIAHVVTYSHNSVTKFPYQSRLLNNFPCLHILTTRNMLPSPTVDWFWGGLNYQIEHHLFPTVPRANLPRVSVKVRKYCEMNNLPYLVDSYWTGYKLILHQLKSIADSVSKITCSHSEKLCDG
ncbi:FAT-3 protein [Loa loa]|uniref:FAT-3 protein n=1 Tax=Loa loa TaxID=7209 RepID=A0A1I7VGB2_LOALO|nr:FAT-3 protein [Loa loa]EFO17699.1 FAT-3 protein [Loa loa]